jgi:hypothetical protein
LTFSGVNASRSALVSGNSLRSRATSVPGGANRMDGTAVRHAPRARSAAAAVPMQARRPGTAKGMFLLGSY